MVKAFRIKRHTLRSLIITLWKKNTLQIFPMHFKEQKKRLRKQSKCLLSGKMIMNKKIRTSLIQTIANKIILSIDPHRRQVIKEKIWKLK